MERQDVAQHVKILGFLHIAMGAFGAAGALSILMLFGGLAALVGVAGGGEPDSLVAIPILAIVGLVICSLTLVLSLPSIAAGYGLLKLKRWARVITIILSALSLLNVPFGTLLGSYGLWVLISPEGESFFQQSAS